MPKFTKADSLDTNCEVGWTQREDLKVWAVKMYWPAGRKTFVRSLRIPYEDSPASLNKARGEASKKWLDFREKTKAGEDPAHVRTISNVVELYLQNIRILADENEKRGAGKHLHLVRGGRGNSFYTHERVGAYENILGHLDKFWPTLNQQTFRKITNRDLDSFYVWAGRNHDWSPSWTNRVITQIRMIWLFGRDNEWTDFIPQLTRPPENLRERARRNLTGDEWLKMVRWARDRYERINPTNKAASHGKDNALQFWAWLNLISWTGLRPPSGRVEKNLIRWGDIRVVDDKRIMVRRDKTDYEAPINPRAYPFLDFLKDFQSQRGLKNCEYIFAHTRRKEGAYEKGAPIKSFKSNWEIMLKELRLWEPWGTPQNKKLVPYSMRGFAITMALREGVPPLSLARSLGTSLRVIDQTYYDFQTEAEFETLVRRSGIEEIKNVTWEGDYPKLV